MPETAIPLREWHEDFGDALWWAFPIVEPPYVGSPLCNDWPGYHTHFTPLPEPPAWPDEIEWRNMIGSPALAELADG